MRILQIANPSAPIPPPTVGGTERIVYAIVEELVRQGHEITLMGEDNSHPPSGVDFIGLGTYFHQEKALERVWKHIVRFGGRYDVIHNHGRLLFYLPRIWGSAAKVHTWHSGDLLVPQMKRMIALHPRNFAFVPCGAWIADRFRHLGGQWTPIPNGLAEHLYQPDYQVKEDAPLVIISRMDPRKGLDDAISIAKKTGRKLLIAGTVGDQPHEKAWFEEHVNRHCDGKQIQFVGPVNDREKQALLGQAAAFLLPLRLSEAFTVVMIEALANGCPVIGYNKYCVPELVKEGVNGFLATDEDDMVKKVQRLKEIDRRRCRKDFEERFTSKVMVGKYVDLYRQLGAR